MTWLTPALGLWAAAIAVPTLLILYFLKLRRRDLEISTTLLWKKAIEDLQANAPFQRLRKNLLLFLQLLALAAALAALAQPQMQASAPPGLRHVIMIDRSASMKAQDAKNARGETVSRLDAAKEQAVELIKSLRDPGLFDKESGDRAMVVVFDKAGEPPRQPFTSDKSLLISAIESITATDSPTSGEEAFALVRAQAPKRTITETDAEGILRTYEQPAGPVGTIHLWSDGRIPDAEKMVPGKEDEFVYHAVGSPDSINVGITSLRAGRAFDDPTKLSIFVGVSSTDPKERTLDVELAIGDDIAGIRSVTLPAATSEVAGVEGTPDAPAAATRRTPGIGGVVFTLERPQGAVFRVRLLKTGPGEDVLPDDDVAWLVAPPAKKMAVAVVGPGSLFITAALEGLPLSKLVSMTAAEYEAAAKAGRVGEFDVVIFNGALPTGPDTPEGASLPPGRFLIFNAVPAPPTGVIDRGVSERSMVVIDWRRDHPALRGLALDNLVIGKHHEVETVKGTPVEVLAISDTGPAILEVASGKTRAILVPFDPADSNWPFDVSFVVFLASAVGHLGDDDAGLGQLVQPGDVLSDRIPIGATDVRLRGPGVDEPLSPGADGRIVFGPVRTTGVYNVSWAGPAGPRDAELGGRILRPFAANLLSTHESDLGTMQTIALGSTVARAEIGTATTITRRLWPWLILAGLAVIMFEWWIYNRKVQL